MGASCVRGRGPGQHILDRPEPHFMTAGSDCSGTGPGRDIGGAEGRKDEPDGEEIIDRPHKHALYRKKP